MNPLISTISISFVSLIIAMLLVIYVTFVFVQDLPVTINIYIRSFELAFRKKEKEKAINETTIFLNDFFKATFNEILNMPNEELRQKLNVSEKEAKQFKDEIKLILDQNKELISRDKVKELSKRDKDFNFVNLVMTNTNLFSNDKAILLQEYNTLLDQNKISDQKYAQEISKINSLSNKQIKNRVIQLRKKYKTRKEILPFAQRMVNDKWKQLKAMTYLL
ncbi:hypothetical protein [Limosilactobacillus walteri]|uniref:Uncharacterized protein n=1 Tax=Limosilactobacillus walteri TaxID=2268022 RepID=A0ABR8P4M2_9LACO|nr:hypothetical protein [Limosilactobacillus walteri]MBD5805940.1 hypothetical protein [Limosilactobacillus walteri]